MKKEIFKHEIVILKNTFLRLIRRHADTNLIKLIKKTHPADLAIVFRYFDEDQQREVFSLMKNNEHTLEFLIELDDLFIANLLKHENIDQIARLIQNASTNEQSYILGALENNQAQSVIDKLKIEEKEEIEEIMAYPDDSAGVIMATDVFTLHKNTTCREALKTLQDHKDAEMVFYIYITDDDSSLVGVASLRALATTPSNTLLKDIMVKKVHKVSPETDQEEVAQLVAQYNYLAVPVVDSDNILLGIVTVDDVVDVIREEATEDFLQMAGAGKDREILLKSSWENARIRIPWLLASWVGGIIASYVIGNFENMLENIIVLASFIPIIIGMGGNVGTQSSTIVVRGMATGRITIGNELTVILKELKVGLLLGVLYGLMLGIFAGFRFIDTNPMIGAVVGLSICSSMLIATGVGTLTPLVLRKLDIDPAIATGPFVTTSIDILGVILYFLIAGLLLSV
jgi:magnesium transporter|tara:strand:+ start:566 stop:1936 length:1371 start_codon:yes stop_codon:yes gene_type:complete